jgi:hypothetical protein
MKKIAPEPLTPVVRLPLANVKRTPHEDPWAFVLLNFRNLANFHAWRYAKMLNDLDSQYDHFMNIILEMVDAYKKYYQHQRKPLSEVVKIIKTVPGYYYRNHIALKEYTVGKTHFDEMLHVVVESESKFIQYYDYYYERFIGDHLGMNKWSDEAVVMFEILSPSEDFIKHVKSVRNGKFYISMKALISYFRNKMKWSHARFDVALKHIKQLKVA